MTDKEKLKAKSKIRENLEAVRQVLDTPTSPDDIGGVQDKMIALIEVAGLASWTESMAKTLYSLEFGLALEMIIETDEKKTGPTILAKLAQGKPVVAEVEGMVSYSERLGRQITMAMDGLRTIISLHKEEMNQSHITQRS